MGPGVNTVNTNTTGGKQNFPPVKPVYPIKEEKESTKEKEAGSLTKSFRQ
jgi:hypothetical protein